MRSQHFSANRWLIFAPVAILALFVPTEAHAADGVTAARLDACLTDGSGCGERSSDAFCESDLEAAAWSKNCEAGTEGSSSVDLVCLHGTTMERAAELMRSVLYVSR